MWHTDSRFQILKMEDGLITHDDGGFRPEMPVFDMKLVRTTHRWRCPPEIHIGTKAGVVED